MTDVLGRESWTFDMKKELLQYPMHFTSLFLYLLIMLTRQIKCQCSKESVKMVKKIATELSKVKNDSMLYTPTLADYEASVIQSEKAQMSHLSQSVTAKYKNDSMLYTPTLADYENCSRSALTCFALEVNVLLVEIQSLAKFQFWQLPRILKLLAYKFQDKMKPCPDCELYKEEKAETFLETLLNVLQQINAEKSCAPKRKKRHLERKKKKRENLKNMI
uniref:Interleukin-21 n=1 Tax=Cyprinus carpio TaxID=7962 RepID=A0A8C2FAY0_CYPCA